jgi:hypothetical protein
MAATNNGPKTILERLGRYSTEILVIAILSWIGFRILGAETQGRAMADHERRAFEVIRAIHLAERDAIAAGGPRFLFLSELVQQAGETASQEGKEKDSPLRRLVRVPTPTAPQVELYRVRGYLVALFVNDPVRNDGRAWSMGGAESKLPGTMAYGAFAWPETYQEGTQWCFFIDHRGTILGSWNHKALFDGLKPPFPPTANPGKDFREADSQNKTLEWFPFDEFLGDIESPSLALRSKKS